jgi:hypothetical protein
MNAINNYLFKYIALWNFVLFKNQGVTNHHRHHWHGHKDQINRNTKIIIGIIGMDTKLRLIET